MNIFNPVRETPRRRKRRSTVPSGSMITGVSIHTGIATQLIVTFSSPITWDGVSVPYEFRAFTEDGIFDSPANVVGVGSEGGWMELEFNADVEDGAAWELGGAMAGISPAVSFPQSGTVAA